MRALRAQWVAAIADRLLGKVDLQDMDVTTTGYSSVMEHSALTSARLAAQNLRLLGIDVSGRRGLRSAVADCRAWEDENSGDPDYREPPYEVAPDAPHSLRCRLSPADPIVVDVEARISSPLSYDAVSAGFADPTRIMRAVLPGSVHTESIPIDLSAVASLIPAPPTHDLYRTPRGPIRIPIADLDAVAARMDVMDAAAAGRRPGNWLARLKDVTTGEASFDVLAPESGVLARQTEIVLKGLKHMIGLPGSGKTTLVMLMLMWLNERNYRVAVMLPSIEASINMLTDLEFYGARVGLLVGQSPTTRLAHAAKLAERAASLGETDGVGQPVPGSPLLGTTCALAAFRADDTEDPPFPHLNPPCDRIRQNKLNKFGGEGAVATRHLCPLASWCGRMRAPRELAQKNIWVGHILSSDTRVQPHFLAGRERMRHLEAIGRTMDLVIVDEADGAQATLDDKGILQLDLTGSQRSMASQILADLHDPYAAGRNDVAGSNVRNYLMQTLRFQKLNSALVSLLQEDRKLHDASGPLAWFRGRFVTGNVVLSRIFLPENAATMPPGIRSLEDDRVEQIRLWWDAAILAAMRDGGDPDSGCDVAKIAAAIGRPVSDVQDAGAKITEHVRAWIASELNTEMAARLKETHDIFFALVPPAAYLDAGEASDMFSLLLGVTAVINQFNVIASAQQGMVAEGVHEHPLTSEGVSEDFLRLVPEAIVGRFSGVRIVFEETSASPNTLKLQYLSFRGAPRALLYRWHEMFSAETDVPGPSVLLTSATSFLEDSPSYHVDAGPDLVLRKRDGAGYGWKKSRWRLLKIPDPLGRGPGGHLQFSGAPLADRRRILRAMIDHFYAGTKPAVKAIGATFDPGRKVAFVVNSYEQVGWFKTWLEERYPTLARGTIAVGRSVTTYAEGDWIVASQVESIGGRDDWDAIVFPMQALSRGVNIVFPEGPRRNEAAIGTIVFLIRPHPSMEDFTLISGLVGRESMRFDMVNLSGCRDLGAVAVAWRKATREALALVRTLMRFPVTSAFLGPLLRPFVANVMIEVLQTVGRAMRGGVKAQVVFVDAAWAINSFSGRGHKDTEVTSMLVAIRGVLEARVNDSDPVRAEVSRALYEPFLEPLRSCEGLDLGTGGMGGAP